MRQSRTGLLKERLKKDCIWLKIEESLQRRKSVAQIISLKLSKIVKTKGKE